MATQDQKKDATASRYGESVKPVLDWDRLIALYQGTFMQKKRPARTKRKWIFRGQVSDWRLKTSLDRVFERYEILSRDRRRAELGMLRSFMRKAHLYMSSVPAPTDWIEWLAIMRHYGAPTRMLDWTYSFYVAVYNAVEYWPSEDMPDWEKEHKTPEWPVVWALDASWLRKDTEVVREEKLALRGLDRTLSLIEKNRYEQNRALRHLMRSGPSLVYSATGFRLNERLVAQEGTFLVQGTLDKPFGKNLEASLDRNRQGHFYRIVLAIDGEERNRFLRELNNMNINRATLYPGLEGLAQSLEMRVAWCPEIWG